MPWSSTCARAELRRFWGVHNEAATALLEEAALYAPTSPPILGALAYAAIQTWLMRGNPVLLARARTAIERGLATGHGEAYLASSVLKLNGLDFVGSATDLGTAIRLAPMSASINETVGKVLDELGAISDGRFYLDTAIALDPGREPVIQCELARIDALHGRFEAAQERINGVLTHPDTAIVRLGVMFQARLLGWNHERERVRTSAPRFVPIRGDAVNVTLAFVQKCLSTNKLYPGEWSVAIAELLDNAAPTRTRMIALQIMTELAMVLHEPDRALESARVAADVGLIDIAWLDRCPLFDTELTSRPEWILLHGEVAARAARMLSAFRATRT